MNENEFLQKIARMGDLNEALNLAMQFIASGKATSVKTIEALRGILEMTLVPQYKDTDGDYDAWYEKNSEAIEAAKQKVCRFVRKQGKYIADDSNVPIEDLQRVYELCFDDTLYAMCNGPEDEAEARDWIWEAFDKGVAINEYANGTDAVQ